MAKATRTPAARQQARAAAKAQHQQKAQAQADKDALKRADAEEVEIGKGRPLTLHQLNLIAKRNSAAARDENRQIANAIAKTAYDGLQGRRNRGVERRAARVRDAEASMAAKQTAAKTDTQIEAKK